MPFGKLSSIWLWVGFEKTTQVNIYFAQFIYIIHF